MKKIIGAFLLLTLSFSSFARVYEWKDFAEFKKEYFEKIDFFQPHIAKEIPAYERKLLDISETIQAKPAVEQTKDDANFLAYTALYILNSKLGYLSNSISIDAMEQSQRFTNSNVPQDIHLARHKKVVSLLQQSIKIDPNHRLVPYWLEGSKFSLDILEGREPSEEQVQKMAKQASSNAFGFFNTYITMKEVNMNEHVKYRNTELEKVMDKSANKMVMLMLKRGEGTKAEIKEGAKDVPYLIVGSLTVLGEYFANRWTQISDEHKGLKNKFKALAEWALLYTRVPLITGFKMYKWSRIEEKKELQNYVAQLKTGGDEKKKKRLSRTSIQKLISCASCHSGPSKPMDSAESPH